jgi:ATP-dependent RNA helicase RhlE
VATDIAARGLDIEQLPMVINFDLPMVPQDYIHRIGRTGRAGSRGQAVSLVSGEEQTLLRDIQALLKCKVEVVPVEGFDGRRRLPELSGNFRPRRTSFR